MRRIAAFVLGLSALSCAPQNAAAPQPAAAPKAEAEKGLISEPAEYRQRPLSAAAGALTFSKHGIGDPYGAGIAYPLWLALLQAYPKELGGSVEGFRKKFGFLKSPYAAPDPDTAVPLGFHLTVDPNTKVSFVVMNCAACHAEVLRLPGGDKLVMGMGNKRVRMHAYDAAMMDIALRPELTAANLGMVAVLQARAQDTPWPPSVRQAITDATLQGLKKRAKPRAQDAARLAAGALPGRVATIEGFSLALRGYGKHVPLGKHLGVAKVPDVVGFPYRDTFSYDASGIGAPSALAAEADFAFGVRPIWYETHRHIGTSLFMYLRQFERTLPYPAEIDERRARDGQNVFDAKCARCHGHYSGPDGARRISYREQVVSVKSVRTDPARLDAVTPEFVAAANSLDFARGVTEVAPTGGYVPPVLIHVWARGLFGHAGQWPSIAFMALPEAERPQRFVVEAGGAYDLAGLGTRYRGATAGEQVEAGSYVQDATVVGYGTQGHSYLADLEPDARTALIEYLKTL